MPTLTHFASYFYNITQVTVFILSLTHSLTSATEKRKKATLFKNFVVGRHIPTAYIQSFFLRHKGDAKGAWDDCQRFVDRMFLFRLACISNIIAEYELEVKETEERRRRMDEEKRKSEGGGGGSYFRIF